MSPSLSGHQAERLIPVGFAETGHRDEPACVAHLFDEVLGGCGEHGGNVKRLRIPTAW